MPLDDKGNLISQAFIEFLNAAGTHWATKFCPDCGTELKRQNCTFFYGGQAWTIPLPLCIKCRPITQVVADA
jgi:hypothetical protein